MSETIKYNDDRKTVSENAKNEQRLEGEFCDTVAEDVKFRAHRCACSCRLQHLL